MTHEDMALSAENTALSAEDTAPPAEDTALSAEDISLPVEVTALAVEVTALAVEVTALAVNVSMPTSMRWTAVRRGEEFVLLTLNLRLPPDGHLAVKAYGRPTAGGRGAYVSFPVPEDPGLAALVSAAADRAAVMWAAHRGLA